MIVLSCVALALPASAQTPPPCKADAYRQFDFWVGTWEVVDPDGAPQGTNRIESILGGCALQESWEGLGGSKGHSYNAYDRATGKWRQTWVDNGGLVLGIEGRLVGNAMVLEGPGRARDGAEILNRVTWTPLADGRVRQHWQISGDGGSTWTDAFVGLYSRKGGSRKGGS